MNSHPDDRLLQRHLDGELRTDERWEVEVHLGGCAGCRERYEALEELVTALGALPVAIQPPVDLWPAIAERIGQGRTAGQPPAVPFRRRIRGSAAAIAGWLTAIAAALVVGIGLDRLQAPTPPVPLTLDDPPPQHPVGGPPAGVQVRNAALGVEAAGEYDAAIADLHAVLDNLRGELRPETVAALERNLHIIDEAIAEAQAALALDPANPDLHRHLNVEMQMKLKMMRMVTLAARTEL